MATKKTGASGKAAPLEPKVAGKLLDKLSTDNEFRRLFKKDPKAALIQAGYKLPKGDAEAAARFEHLCGCAKVKNIAPKAAIIKSRDELKRFLTSELGQQPHRLDAGYSEGKPTLRSRK
ncbi:NHLP-related RiPP peptide [Pseudoxanthomonas wuyuanensis]